MEIKSYSQCTRCVMDTSDSEIVFDLNGVCNHCKNFDRAEAYRQADLANLPKYLGQIKKDGEGQLYDVLVGLSGGVDSSLVLHKAVELGLRPLCYSVDNGWNTPESDENIMRLVEGLKVPFFRYTIDTAKFKELQGTFIKSGTANIEIPTDHILMASTYEMANKYKIKWILSGGNVATESVMPRAWGYQPRDAVHIRAIYKKFTGKKLTGLPICGMLKLDWYKWIKGVKTLYLLDFFEYNREEAKKLLIEKYGWKNYGEKHCENLFTWWFQNYYLFEKFHFDKRKAHLSSLILSGQIAREDAIEELKQKPIYPELGIEKRIWKYPIKDYKNYPNDEFWWILTSYIVRFLRRYGIIE